MNESSSKPVTLTAVEIHECLIRRGHSIWDGDSGGIPGTEVSPPRDVCATVALNLDPTLKPGYRERYFACLVDCDLRPVLGDDPDFDPGEPLATIAREDPPTGGFVAGPFRWLLRRLRRFPTVVLWPGMGARGDEAGTFVDPALLDEMPRLRSWLRAAPPASTTIGAIVLDLSDADDARVLWEVGNRVGKSHEDFFAADPDCAEVYKLHHHDKVIISIPDGPTRRQLLDELAGRGDVLEDCSGYAMDEGGEEWGADSADGGPG
jgi:hypothetical protein